MILKRFTGQPNWEWLEKITDSKDNSLNLNLLNSKKFSFEEPSYLSNQYKEKISKINNALINETVLLVNRISNQDLSANIIIHPHFLKIYNNKWYLFGHVPKSDIIPYVIPIDKNINSIKEINSNYISTTINYEEPIDGGESFFDSIIGVTNFLNKNPENIKLRVHNYQMFKRIDSNPPHFSYTLEYQCDNNNYFDFSITVKENPELYKYLLSNCNFLEVLSPLKIRNNLLDKIKSAANYY